MRALHSNKTPQWSSWLNPISYAFESLLVNEVHGREFPCATSSLVPPYGQGQNFQCAVSGAVAGEINVSGDAWVESSYGYSYSHLWRNLGILFAFLIFFFVFYLVASEINSESTSTAEFLVFRRGHVPSYLLKGGRKDEEATHADEKGATTGEPAGGKQAEDVKVLPAQKDIFTWRNVTLDIKIKGEPRRLLDGISGWVKPGTLTALMGTSGAGKTTLLDALAQRTNIGVLTGDMVRYSSPLIDFISGGLLTCISAGEWQTTRRVLPTQDWLRATARSPFGNHDCERSPAVLRLPPTTKIGVH